LRYTLLIPTYNRPGFLGSLLGYLAARRFGYPIRVLDSSSGDALSRNRQTVERTGLDILHQVYDPATPVFQKMEQGALAVESTYCSFCADDDILLTDCLEPLLDVLDGDPSVVAAQGYSVNFNVGEYFDISGVAYWTPSVAGDDGLKRIVEQMGNYQAFSYAVHRTGEMKFALSQLPRVQSLLAKELLASSLTLVRGRVIRLPQFFMARNTNESIATAGWHPYHFLASDPAELISEYAAHRAVVLEHMTADERCRSIYTRAQMERVLDLVHLKYLAPMMSGAVLDYVTAQSLEAGRQSPEIVQGIWNIFIRPGDRGLLAHLWRAFSEPSYAARLAGYFGRLVSLNAALKFRENLDASFGRRLGSMLVTHRTREGHPRRYHLFREFLNQDLGHGRRISASEIRAVIEQLDGYVQS
jgi:glycosyltransferase domain-containing protein